MHAGVRLTGRKLNCKSTMILQHIMFRPMSHLVIISTCPNSQCFYICIYCSTSCEVLLSPVPQKAAEILPTFHRTCPEEQPVDCRPLSQFPETYITSVTF